MPEEYGPNLVTTLAKRLRPFLLQTINQMVPATGGGHDGAVFVPAIGGNAGGFFGDHQDRLVYGGGPWTGGSSVEFNQAGVRINYPESGEDGNEGSNNYSWVAYGIWSIPANITGFIAEPIFKWTRVSGAATSDYRIYHAIKDVSKVGGVWELAENLSSDAAWTLPFTGSAFWSNMEAGAIHIDTSLEDYYYVENGSDWSYGEVYGSLYPGQPIMFAAENWNFGPTGAVARGWFLGWHVTLLP